MSLKGKILVALISVFCFCLGITATVLLSPNRSFDSVLPHARTYTFRMRSSAPRFERNYYSYSYSDSFADREISRAINDMAGTADQWTLDRYERQISRLESSGRAYMGVYLRSGNNCAMVDQTEEGTPASYVLRRGDAIVGIGMYTVTDGDSLRRALLSIEPGVPVPVRFYRNGSFVESSLTPANKSIGQLPMSHLALGSAYVKAGRTDDGSKQFNIYAAQSSNR